VSSDEGATAGPPAGGSVTIRIERRVAPEQQDAYAALLRQLLTRSQAFPGFVDGRVIRPMRGELEFRTVLTFRSQKDLEAWKLWPERLALLAEADGIAEAPIFADISGTAQTGRLALALTPFEQFVRTSVSGIGLLLFGTVAALVLANSPLAPAYEAFWHTTLTVGTDAFGVEASLRHWVNDGLMALFFFLVGLEIKREVLVGEMRVPRHAALAIAAAVGGVVVPALVFLAFVPESAGRRGWGVPIGTDTAFALGIITLFGTRVRPVLLVFLTAFSIVDDILAVAVIAVFYTESISLGPLAVALLLLVALVVVNRAGFHRWPIYALLGAGVWVAVLKSGVHATAAGVLVALVVPVRSWINPSEFLVRGRRLLDDFEAACFLAPSILTNEPQQQATHRLDLLLQQVETPMTYFHSRLTPWVAFGILPVFAFANAGLPITSGFPALRNPITLGVAAGLIVGKPVGIALFSWLSVAVGIARLPKAITWRHIGGVACLGGVGFTISLFITELAFGEGELAHAARVGIFVGSLVAGTAGYAVLRAVLPPPRSPEGEQSPAAGE
jgi:NhaA family Na+:H+ antiporter